MADGGVAQAFGDQLSFQTQVVIIITPTQALVEAHITDMPLPLEATAMYMAMDQATPAVEAIFMDMDLINGPVYHQVISIAQDYH